MKLIEVPCCTTSLKVEKVRNVVSLLKSTSPSIKDIQTSRKEAVIYLESSIKELKESSTREITELMNSKEELLNQLRQINPNEKKNNGDGTSFMQFVGTACGNSISIFVPEGWVELNVHELSGLSSLWISPSNNNNNNNSSRYNNSSNNS